MKRYRLIPAMVLLMLFPLLQGCEDVDPACENAEYAPAFYSNYFPQDGDVLSDLYMISNRVYYYKDIVTDSACGHTLIDMIYRIKYSNALSYEQGLRVFTFLEINGKKVDFHRSTGTTADGKYVLLKGGTLAAQNHATPAIFTVRFGCWFSGRENITLAEGEDLITKYFEEFYVAFDYLKLN